MFLKNTPKPTPATTPSKTVAETPMSQTRTGKAPSIISADMSIRGDLNGGGDLQIEGKVFGKIDVGHLVVAEGGSVEGEIIAKAVRISGQMVGSIQAGSVTLTPTARVQGDIHHDVLAIEAGAQLEGQCKRNSSSSANKLLTGPTLGSAQSIASPN